MMSPPSELQVISMPVRTHRLDRWRFLPLLVLASAFSAQAQDAPPAPAPPQKPASPAYTIHARVPLTILDIVVTDAKGRPVHNLKQSDFTILEDKQPMLPNSFE